MRNLVFMVILIAIQSFAAPSQTDPCLSKIAQLLKWQPMESNLLSCLTKDPDFGNATSFLCANDRSSISIEYQKYSDAKDVYIEAL